MSYQDPNIIIIKNKKHSTLSGNLPHENINIDYKEHKNIKALTKVEWKKKYPNPNSVYKHSTSCYRRYYATWKIKDDKLYLIDIIGEYELINTNELFADWFTGEIKIGIGPISMEKKDIHMSYGIYHSKIRVLFIENGIVKKDYIEDR